MKYVTSTIEEAQQLVDAWALAAGFPFPPDRERADIAATKRQAWLVADAPTRTTLAASGAYRGWSLWPTEVRREPRGPRFWVEAPDDLATIVKPMAATHFGRTLPTEHTRALDESAAKLAAEFPADWRGKLDAVAERTR